MALPERFIELGNEVIITGRDEPTLNAFKQKHPGVHVRAHERRRLVRAVFAKNSR
jgi:short-subunit dehydrogenase involved in D-alanine esterification of teichoic acids